MSILKKIDRYFEESIVVVLFSLMVILTFVQVLSRFVFHLSLGWSEEISRYLFVWLVYISAAMAAKHRRHIRVEIIDQLFPRAVSKWFGLLSDLLWIAFSLLVAYYGYNLVVLISGHGQLSPAVQLPMGLVYIIIPFGFFLIAFRVLQGIVGRFRSDTDLTDEEKLQRAIEG
ncbi:TRAP transporter small permease [Tepidibacillus sp. HK-1]|uniref:TRAP transporter small permease n=1 Tax=Tepidibacillus sp. HK-1 TaxID=1883407 RepID=UPI0008529660|nr:TRAP transporter small permease [Tepidibacillus sp. HK-1]GBF10656.1 sialic acid TRAP transporter permease protein SiaT [Tepidibacillus sp. HK-1]